MEWCIQNAEWKETQSIKGSITSKVILQNEKEIKKFPDWGGGNKKNPRDYMFAYAHTHSFRDNKLVQDKGSIYKN